MSVNEIKLVRHGQSQTNVGEVPYGSVGDFSVLLTDEGKKQARHAGEQISLDWLSRSLLYCSPYMRARQTMSELLSIHDIKVIDHEFPMHAVFPYEVNTSLLGFERPIYEDARLREVDHGYDDVDEQETLRKIHGWFYYRFKGGESPADCYDRLSHFLETLMRQIKRKTRNPTDQPNVLIASHGLTIRCFVTRFLHLTPEQFETLANPKNGDVITLSTSLSDPQFSSGRWGVEGLRFRESDADMDARK